MKKRELDPPGSAPEERGDKNRAVPTEKGMAVVCVLQCMVSVGIRLRQPKMLPKSDTPKSL